MPPLRRRSLFRRAVFPFLKNKKRTKINSGRGGKCPQKRTGKKGNPRADKNIPAEKTFWVEVLPLDRRRKRVRLTQKPVARIVLEPEHQRNQRRDKIECRQPDKSSDGIRPQKRGDGKGQHRFYPPKRRESKEHSNRQTSCNDARRTFERKKFFPKSDQPAAPGTLPSPSSSTFL